MSSSNERAKSCEKPVALLDCLDSTPPEEPPPVAERQNPSFKRACAVVDDDDDDGDCIEEDGERTPLPGSCQLVALRFDADELVRNKAIRESSAAAEPLPPPKTPPPLLLRMVEFINGRGDGGSSDALAGAATMSAADVPSA